jgi:hypothetical protein
MFGIEIEEASWCLGMSGNITFEVLPERVKYRLRQSMGSGKNLEQWDEDKEEWSHSKRVTDDEVIALFDPCWDMPRFIAAWAGFAEGSEAGERAERCRLVAHTLNTIYYTVEGNQIQGTDALPGFASTPSGMKQLILDALDESADNAIFTIDMEAKTIGVVLKDDPAAYDTYYLHEIKRFA